MLTRTVLGGVLLLSCGFFATALAQTTKAPPVLESPDTLPIIFTKTISADHAHIGDPVVVKTTQVVHLMNGEVIPAGAKITGHIVAANAFEYDRTPYAQQKQSELSIQFESVAFEGASLPLNVTVRAIADPLTSQAARMVLSWDIDPSQTMTQIGGDQIIRGQPGVVNGEGDVVGYVKSDGVYAHLIANDRCDSSSVEVSVGLYSASACGLYGFVGVHAQDTGSLARPSMLTLISTRLSPKIWEGSTALLEVLPVQHSGAAH